MDELERSLLFPALSCPAPPCPNCLLYGFQVRARLADFAAQAAALAQPIAGGGEPKPAEADTDAHGIGSSDGSGGGSVGGGLEVESTGKRPPTSSEPPPQPPQPPQDSGSGASSDVADVEADVPVGGADAKADLGGVDAGGGRSAEVPETKIDLPAEGGGDEGDKLGGSSAASDFAESSVSAEAGGAPIESGQEDISGAQAQESVGGSGDSRGVNDLNELELPSGGGEGVAVEQGDGAAVVDI